MPLAKRDIAATLAGAAGLTALLERLPARPLLIVLNYHRIGDAAATPYDSEVFSTTCDGLDRQVSYLKKRVHLATLDEAIETVEKGRPARPAILLTFDDGYLDNYQAAFPVLASHGVQGVFFLPTAFIGTNRIPWWDSIAYILKRSRKPAFRIHYPEARGFDMARDGIARVVRTALNLYASPATQNGERFITQLEEACGAARPDGSERCFMNWEEAAEMARGGMAIGSHTHSHEVLAKLSEERQLEEMTVSRRMLESRLGIEAQAIAYPVGLPESFTAATVSAAKQAGYRVGFSFYGGFNAPGAIDRYGVRRVGISNPTPARFRFQTALARAGGKWF